MKEDLEKEIGSIFRDQWTIRDSEKVPQPENIALTGNDGIKLEATILYSDLVESTKLVDTKKLSFAAEVYKSFVLGCCRVIREGDGFIRSFDGDRIMAIFVGSSKNTAAAKTALRINYLVTHVINKKLKEVYSSTDYELNHVTGIDTSDVLVTRTGIRGSNDLVWVGRSANYAAKLCGIRETGYTSYISKEVFDVMNADVKTANDGRNMWESRTWNGKSIYRSNFWWSF